MDDCKFSIVAWAELPRQFPTHHLDGSFWESLGRTVATYGFLEDVLGKSIYAFTATRIYEDPQELQHAYDAWLPKLEQALVDPLGNLINSYEKAVREHHKQAIKNLDDLLEDLRKAATIRNILCHSSWGLPDAAGASVPHFVNRQKEVVTTAMDKEYVDRVQRHVAKLSCAVIDSVTCMGWQFPGSRGPGKEVWPIPNDS